MSIRLKTLIGEVRELYKNSKREWGHWAVENHIERVAYYAEKIAKEVKAKSELCVAGAWLHDIGDVWIERSDPKHEARGLNEAEKLLKSVGFSGDEIYLINQKIIKPHSCKELKPKIIEGKVLATADAVAHLEGDFYLHMSLKMRRNKSYDELKNWLNNKVDRDYFDKIFFSNWKRKVKPIHGAWKVLLNKHL